jgi:hypothetical protein
VRQADPLDNLEAAGPRHLYVEKENVIAIFLERRHDFSATTAFAGNSDLVVRGQQKSQTLAR